MGWILAALPLRDAWSVYLTHVSLLMTGIIFITLFVELFVITINPHHHPHPWVNSCSLRFITWLSCSLLPV